MVLNACGYLLNHPVREVTANDWSKEELLILRRRIISCITEQNLPLVKFVLSKRPASGLRTNDDEYYSAGQEALLKAVLTFDPWRGRKFSTYAYRLIKNKFNLVYRVENKYNSCFPCSLDQAISPAVSYSLELDDDRFDDGALFIFGLILKPNKVLSLKERRILVKRFGLVTQTPKTLEEVGKDFGVGKERIRQVQNQALLKLRLAVVSAGKQ